MTFVLGKFLSSQLSALSSQLSALVAGLFLVSNFSQAAPSSWQYSPPAAGRALYSGGWFLSYSLGKVSASPEFEFPLQLVYDTSRQEAGLFGSQWFCPQLESGLVPIDKGYLLWTMPSGQQMLLEKADKGQSDFRSQDELWRCENQKSLFKIFNQEGWQYHYSKGKLVAVLSPTGRILEFGWQARKLSSVRLRDSAVPGDIDVLQIAYNGDGNAIGLKLQGYAHEFAYREIERSHTI